MLYLEVFFYNILPLQLFDIVARYDTLRNVINSVTRNLKSILLTAILALILIFLYSIFGYIFFPGDFLMPTHPVEDMEASCPSECILVTHECINPYTSNIHALNSYTATRTHQNTMHPPRRRPGWPSVGTPCLLTVACCVCVCVGGC